MLRHQYPSCVIYSMGIVYRENWLPLSCQLASVVNNYLSTVQGVTICNMNKFVKPTQFCSDKTHFNHEGYHLFMDRGLGPLLDQHYKQVRTRRPNRKRRALHVSVVNAELKVSCLSPGVG